MEKKSKFVQTKVVATIGPASEKEEILTQMMKSGMSVARLNFSHGSYEYHKSTIDKVRKLSAELDIPVAILQDLCGPKIRLGILPAPVELKKNQIIKLSIDSDPDATLYTDFKELPEVAKPGEALLIDDGNIELTILEVFPKYVTCEVKVPGIATSRKGINLPQSKISIPVFTEKDRRDFEFGLQHGVDMVAMSFVDSPDNIIPVKELMEKYSREIPVIAKIERPVAVDRMDEIIDAFDGIMIARGDLGVEVPPEDVPLIQKKLIVHANLKNKLVITATQMLESMINNPRPTRAEASDVSNAILDGTDAVMLSAETASGKYPVEAVAMMKRIAWTTEKSDLYHHTRILDRKHYDYTEAIVKSAAEIADELKADYIVVFSFTGHTAMKISKYRPICPVIALSAQKDVVVRMASYWGVSPHHIIPTQNTDEMIKNGDDVLKSKCLIKPGSIVITVSGLAPMKGATNLLKITKFCGEGSNSN